MIGERRDAKTIEVQHRVAIASRVKLLEIRPQRRRLFGNKGLRLAARRRWHIGGLRARHRA